MIQGNFPFLIKNLIRLEKIKKQYLEKGHWKQLEKLCQKQFSLISLLKKSGFIKDFFKEKTTKTLINQYKNLFLINKQITQEIGYISQFFASQINTATLDTYEKNGMQSQHKGNGLCLVRV